MKALSRPLYYRQPLRFLPTGHSITVNKSFNIFVAVLALVVSSGTTVSIAAPLEGGVSPQRIQQISAMLGDKPSAFGPKIEDRESWNHLAATKACRGEVKSAEKLLATPMPEMTEELYMLYKKNGQRTKEYARVRSDRYGRVSRYALAECIENQGRFIKPLEAALRSVCQEKTWVYNFHDANLAEYKGQKISIDLGSSDLAENLGECLYLLGIVFRLRRARS